MNIKYITEFVIIEDKLFKRNIELVVNSNGFVLFQ